jgi:uncharacterized protein
MSIVGTVDSLWRYPVKSMRGEELEEAFVGFSGVYGDRYFAFRSSARPKGFPYLTGREQQRLLRYRPRFRNPEKAAEPPNLAEAQLITPGINPVNADPEDLRVDVETPRESSSRSTILHWRACSAKGSATTITSRWCARSGR